MSHGEQRQNIKNQEFEVIDPDHNPYSGEQEEEFDKQSRRRSSEGAEREKSKKLNQNVQDDFVLIGDEQERADEQLAASVDEDEQLRRIKIKVNEKRLLRPNKDYEVESCCIKSAFYEKEMLILEKMLFEIDTKYVKGGSKKVQRRYSDFEWLLSELRTFYLGLILPGIPSKDVMSFINMPLLNTEEQRNLLLSYRKIVFQIFIQKLLDHDQLRYAPRLHQFLQFDDKQFNELKESSEASRAQAQAAGNTGSNGLVSNIYYNFQPGVVQNTLTYLQGTLGGFANYLSGRGTNAPEKRRESEKDADFERYKQQILAERTKLQQVHDFVRELNQLKKQQEENTTNITTLFQEIEKLQVSQMGQLGVFCGQHFQQIAQSQKSSLEQVEYPLAAQLLHYDFCLTLIEERRLLDQNLFDCQQALMQRGGSQNVTLYHKILEQRADLEYFEENFLTDVDRFAKASDEFVKRVVSDHMKLQQNHQTRLRQIWKGQEQTE